jgi:ribose-phosphate pyrophosphokinase
MKFLLTPSTRHLERSLLEEGCRVDRYESYTFADGERGYRLKGRVRGEPVVILASILPDPESFFHLMALNRLALENGAVGTILIIPYLGYARQDRPTRAGEGSIGIMLLESLRDLNASRLFLVDVHSELIRRALPSTAAEQSALPLIARICAKHPPEVVVSPDAGFLPRAEQFARMINPSPQVAVVDKIRPRPNTAVARRLHGEVRGRDVLVLDDMIDTGGTLVEAVKLIRGKGAGRIRLAATHGIFSKNARERLSRLPVDEILITNTLPQLRHPKIRVLDIVPTLLHAVEGV